MSALLRRKALTLDEDAIASDDKVVFEFLQIARMVTLSDVARRRRDATVYARKNLTVLAERLSDQDYVDQPFDVLDLLV